MLSGKALCTFVGHTGAFASVFDFRRPSIIFG
jgi:hypothetical protein